MDPGPGCHSEAESEPDPDAEPEARAGPARVLVPWPVPIRELPEPEPGPLEPIDRETHDELVAALKEARRSAIAEGTVLNRVVYDAVHFVPAEPSRVPGGALLFESRFESGNLRRAIHVSGTEYDLLLNWDYGTRGHTQWYLFAVRGAEGGRKYRFNIINFCKAQSLYRQGMKPLIYSAQTAQRSGIGWHRGGSDVLYYDNGVHRRDKEKGSHSTLSFQWTAEWDDDVIYFAMCYPYTYSHLRSYLNSLEASPLRGQHVRRKRLTLTLLRTVSSHQVMAT